MSHSKERVEKNCLNCGAELTGRYCYNCGQENTEPKETVLTLVSHFFNDITHFDGKFFSTVKYLITKPGFLSSEYIKGRRASYLHPIRMYVFTSAFFFIIFFSLFRPESIILADKNEDEQLKELTQASNSLKEKLPDAKADTALYAAMQRSINNIDNHTLLLKSSIDAKEKKSAPADPRQQINDSINKALKNNPKITVKIASGVVKLDSVKSGKRGPMSDDIDFGEVKFNYNSQLAYDSVQKELPANKKAGWNERAIAGKIILLNSKFKDNRKEGLALFLEKFMHTLPQALFVSLPVFALLLLILYSRRNFYYADHIIFSIHLYCATFILLLFIFGIDKIGSITGMEWIKYSEVVFILGIFFYLYKAMRKFYGQGRGKTILKFLLLNIFSFFIVMTLAGLFFMLSVLQFS